MQQIPGLDLSKIDEQARKAFAKIAEGRITDYLRGLRIQAHNFSMKAARLRTEAEQADAQQQVLEDRIAKIVAGDWSAIEPMELQDKGGGQDKQDKS